MVEITNAPITVGSPGDTVTVTCNPGYTVSGNNPITCNTNKQFSNIPTCELVECTADNWGTLGIEHSVTPANLPVRYLTEVTVKCVEMYTTTTNSVVKCGTTGQFTYTGDKPVCYSGLYLIL